MHNLQEKRPESVAADPQAFANFTDPKSITEQNNTQTRTLSTEQRNAWFHFVDCFLKYEQVPSPANWQALEQAHKYFQIVWKRGEDE